ncbi:ABC transporter substrate-binding protein [Paenibacillus favisporus]|uniref:ABC transporter substrate-binding protein n=1 Tax=Paenibacillus TaxID=44249 RepID=UPI00164274B5|nr:MULTISPECIES: ABC transporter substrate-binding protein [Paenibacillus]MEC0178850.1 ABC transporter substrate-binding protein [Paenibacillus favisporus]
MKVFLTRRKMPVLFVLVLLATVIMVWNAYVSKGATFNVNSELLGKNAASSSIKHNGPVTISFWYSWVGGFQDEFYDTVVKPFEEANPDIKVEMTFIENSDNSQGSDKLLTAIAGGKAPDVAMIDRFIVGEWAAMGSIEDISAYANREDMASIYYKSVWAESQYDGKTYALPWNMDSRAMYYNKTMMKQAGFDPDNPPRTIGGLDAMAERMFKTNGDGAYEQVGFVPWMGQGFLYTHGWNFGGEWERSGKLTPNDPRNVKALEWVQGYAEKYDVKKLLKFSEMMRQTGRNSFLSGKVGFVYEGNWLLNEMEDLDFEWGVAPMPTIDGSRPVTWSGGWSFVMPKGAKNKEEAWRFMKYVAGKEGTLLWASREGGRNDLMCIPEVNAKLGLDQKEPMKVFTELLGNAYIRPVTPVGGYMWDEMLRVQTLAMNLQGEPEELLNEMKKNVDAELAKVMGYGNSKMEHPQGRDEQP